MMSFSAGFNQPRPQDSSAPLTFWQNSPYVLFQGAPGIKLTSVYTQELQI